ncbi:hypothetical protein KPL78_23025 [Roseomonas sp. HJA6]|uniref:Sialate O-acetylesterase domain-containing protein n=1 Tax=Roseomonas alba TaxID=2846776 RepID=A0ABS7AEL6_9PROT|nr:hypothetical protein [Neoroseomonas alba]MBW6400752.1 hypothetical protein [Neoroseomonas alba]
MTHRYADRVMVLSSSVGTGDMVLGQAVAGFQDFAAAGLVVGDTCDVCIEDPLARTWETVRVTLSAAGVIERGATFDSSADGARIDFGEGLKRIYLVQPGAVIAEDKTATQAARGEVAALVAGFEDSVVGATQAALDVIAGSVSSIIVDSAQATDAAASASADAMRAVLHALEAGSAAALARSAADSTAASVTNAAIQRATLAEMQAVTGATEGQLGVVYGVGDDRGQYRYLSGAWTREGPTIPDLVDSVDAVAEAVRSDPDVAGIAFAVVDETGAAALTLSGDGTVLATAGAELVRGDDASVLLRRADAIGGSLHLTAEGVDLGAAAVAEAAGPAGVRVVDESDYAAIAVAEDGSGHIGALRIEADGTLRGPGGDALIPSLGDLSYETVGRDDLVVGWRDDEGYIGVALLPDGTLVSGAASADNAAYSASEIAERNARALAYSAQIVRLGDEDVQRPVAAYNHVLGYGQSLSVGAQGFPALTTAQPYPGLLTLGQSVHTRNVGNNAWAPFGASAFLPLAAQVLKGGRLELLSGAEQAALAPSDGNWGETPLEAASLAFRRAQNNAWGAADDAARQIVVSACGYPGLSVASLSKGNGYYGRVTDCATAAKAVAATAGGDYCVPALIYLQGEQDYVIGTTRAAYKALVKQLVADIRADVQAAIAAQARPFGVFTYQTGGGFTSDAQQMAVGMAQLELALEEPHWWLVGPVYPMTDKDGHLTANGYRWWGEQCGKVMAKVLLRNEGWRPLHPTRLTRRGRSVLVDFHVPEPPLQFALPYVIATATDYASKGFSARDAGGAVGIADVEIVSDTAVMITLGRDVSGALSLVYAAKSAANGNGCLCDSDPWRAALTYVYAPGSGQDASENIASLVGKPYPLHNWCCAFDLPVSID